MFRNIHNATNLTEEEKREKFEIILNQAINLGKDNKMVLSVAAFSQAKLFAFSNQLTDKLPQIYENFKSLSIEKKWKNQFYFLHVFEEMLKISHKVKQSQLAEIMGIDQKKLSELLFEWRNDISFTIDGEYITAENLKHFTTQIEEKLQSLHNHIESIPASLQSIENKIDDIQKYMPQLEETFDKLEKLDNIEQYLISKLGGDWERIRTSWESYRLGDIARSEFLREGMKVIGKKFVQKLTKLI